MSIGIFGNKAKEIAAGKALEMNNLSANKL